MFRLFVFYFIFFVVVVVVSICVYTHVLYAFFVTRRNMLVKVSKTSDRI